MSEPHAVDAGASSVRDLSSLPETLPSEKGERNSIDTSLLMAIAAALIVNSHLERFYPRSFLAADGLLGNSIFFMLSGFGLQMSAHKQQRSFLPYYLRRILRLYPALLLIEVLFAIIDHRWQLGPHPLAYITTFIYPTDYTFIRCIVPFYVFIYPLLRARSANAYAAAILLLTIPYLICYLPDAWQIPEGTHLSMGSRSGYMHAIAYLQVMLMGGWFAMKSKLLGRPGLAVYASTLMVILVYFGLKFVMVVLGRFAAWYGLLHLLTFFACALMMVSGTDQRITQFYRAHRALKTLIGLIAALTLEIYLVHSNLIEYDWLVHLRFPLNILVLLALTLVISLAVAEVLKPLNKSQGRRRA